MSDAGPEPEREMRMASERTIEWSSAMAEDGQEFREVAPDGPVGAPGPAGEAEPRG